MQDREDRTDDTLRRQPLEACWRPGLAPPTVDRVDQDSHHARTPLQGNRARTKRVDDRQAPQTRLIVQELQQRTQPGTHPLDPALGLLERRGDTRRGVLDRLLERGEKTVLAVAEELIERPPRDTRAGNHMRDR